MLQCKKHPHTRNPGRARILRRLRPEDTGSMHIHLCRFHTGTQLYLCDKQNIKPLRVDLQKLLTEGVPVRSFIGMFYLNKIVQGQCATPCTTLVNPYNYERIKRLFCIAL